MRRRTTEEVWQFTGDSIEGVCEAKRVGYHRGGRGTWQIFLFDGIEPIELVSDLHRRWGDFHTSWQQVSERLAGLPVDQCRRIIGVEYPRTAERLNRIEAFFAKHPDAQIVYLGFGNPTRRQMSAGFWIAPKSVTLDDGTVITASLTGKPSRIGDPPASWSEPVLNCPYPDVIVELAGVYYTPGMHGGAYTLELLFGRLRRKQ